MGCPPGDRLSRARSSFMSSGISQQARYKAYPSPIPRACKTEHSLTPRKSFMKPRLTRFNVSMFDGICMSNGLKVMSMSTVLGLSSEFRGEDELGGAFSVEVGPV